MKKLNKKGFTLIEIIVVVVVLAVLMAVGVPSVMKYINEADNAKYMAQGRSVMNIAQTELIKAYVGDNQINATEATKLKNIDTYESGKNGMGTIKTDSIKVYVKTVSANANTLTVTEGTGGTITVTPGSNSTEITGLTDAATFENEPELLAVEFVIDTNVKVIAVANEKVYVGK